MRETPAFKALAVTDFRKQAARSLRDAAYARRGIAFLHQASRYRGKANYRDAIFLAYTERLPALRLMQLERTLLVSDAPFAGVEGSPELGALNRRSNRQAGKRKSGVQPSAARAFSVATLLLDCAML